MARAAASRRDERRQQQHDLGRNQLLAAAEEIFGTKGYHDATLREVSELAEFSVGSVYSFFTNKDDLFLQVFLRRGIEFLDGIRMLTAKDSKPTGTLDILRRLVAYEVDFFRGHPYFGRLYLRTASLAQPLPTTNPDETDAGGVATFEEVMATQAHVFATGQKEGVIRPGDPATFVSILSGMVTAYLAVDPIVVSGGIDVTERLPLGDFTEMVLATFAA